MIVGVGVDIVDVARFERSLARTPALAPRLFDDVELTRPPVSLAARFAAKEALIKALGDAAGFRWHDMVVRQDDHGKPSFELRGALAAIVADRGVSRVHLSMSHDGGLAIAYVVAEAER